ncbi:MAG: sodium:proton antiporter [Phycisphaerae bacterium]|nr:sodium:proton antiporter [Tepidisphaeraceae bacterium]
MTIQTLPRRVVALIVAAGAPSAFAAGAPDGSAGVPLVWVLPFALLLACIALMPFVHKHGWERHYPKVATGLAAIVAGYYFFVRKDPGPWLAEMREYVSFIVLLTALYVVSGGIAIRINRRATPLANTVFLLIGAVLANLFGTTGASMLLIRPWLRMNRGHLRPYHVVFFIFVVSNVGGSLTPVGDPPLFLGYLKGVPFWWVAEHMRQLWLLVVGALLAVFYVIDSLDHRRAGRVHEGDAGPQVHLLGVHNFLFIGAVVWAVFRPGTFDAAADLWNLGVTGGRVADLILSREVLMVAATVASRAVTARAIYQANEFTYGPMREVAILFVGVFSTMVPALQWIEHNADRLGVRTPGQTYFASGTLSSVLDNAPTYLTFLQARIGRLDPGQVEEVRRVVAQNAGRDPAAFDRSGLTSERTRGAVEALLRYHPESLRDGTITREQADVALLIGSPDWALFVLAISAGSVFWGACTYIGNGPNFMVKAIADAHGAPTPGFVRYVVQYTLPVLIPIYVLVWWVFFA